MACRVHPCFLLFFLMTWCTGVSDSPRTGGPRANVLLLWSFSLHCVLIPRTAPAQAGRGPVLYLLFVRCRSRIHHRILISHAWDIVVEQSAEKQVLYEGTVISILDCISGFSGVKFLFCSNDVSRGQLRLGRLAPAYMYRSSRARRCLCVCVKPCAIKMKLMLTPCPIVNIRVAGAKLLEANSTTCTNIIL